MIYSMVYQVGWMCCDLPEDTIPLDLGCVYFKNRELPRCPSGGYYIIGPLDWDPICSYHGNLLAEARLQRLKESGVRYKSCAVAPNGALLLDLRETGITDLSPLRDIRIRSLGLDGTQVADLTPLRRTGIGSLRTLSIYNTRVTDLSPLDGMDLAYLHFNPKQITNGLEIITPRMCIATNEDGW